MFKGVFKGVHFQNEKCDCIKYLKLVDPACGSGNFLTETYLSLRRLENQVIALLIGMEKGQIQGQMLWGSVINPIKVSVKKFPLPQAGSMFLLILIQKKKPSPGQKLPKKA